MKQTPLRKASKKMAAQKRQEAKLTQRLLEHTEGNCEIHKGAPGFFGLSKHEIITRARGGDPTDTFNCLLLCETCHNHRTFPMTGTPLSTEAQLEIAMNRSQLCTD